MPDQRLSDLYASNPAGPLTGAELLELTQAGASVAGLVRQLMRPRSVEVTASATLAAGHEGVFISANHATVGITLTVPPNSAVPFPIDTEIHVRQRGAAGVTIAAGSGVTINQPASQTKVLKEQYAVVTLKKVATDTWALFGMLGAA